MNDSISSITPPHIWKQDHPPRSGEGEKTLAGVSKEWFAESASIEGSCEIGAGIALSPLLKVIRRPLLTDGSLTKDQQGSIVILIREDVPQNEIPVTLWHETIHLLRSAGGFDQDEIDVEKYARLLAAGFPEISEWCGLGKAPATPEGASPRTDAAEETFESWAKSSPQADRMLVDAFLCRTIETELTAAQAEIAELKGKVERQRERIVYLEGATNHACGTPLSLAKKECESLKAEIADNHLEREGFKDEIARLNRTIAGMNEAHGVLVSEHADAKAEIAELRPWALFFRDQKSLGEIAAEMGQTVYAFTRPFTKACNAIVKRSGDAFAEVEQLKSEIGRLRAVLEPLQDRDWFKDPNFHDKRTACLLDSDAVKAALKPAAPGHGKEEK